jgi:hypothetical protein
VNFFLETGHDGHQNIANFMPISDMQHRLVTIEIGLVKKHHILFIYIEKKPVFKLFFATTSFRSFFFTKVSLHPLNNSI